MSDPRINVAELLADPAGVPRARAMLQRAEWAARAFARYDKGSVDAIVRATAAAAAAKAREYAEWAVRETGFGVVEHKVLKNIACSTGIADYYAGHDYVTPRVDAEAKIVEVPRPAGVVLALTPSTNPVATVFFKSLLALMDTIKFIKEQPDEAAAIAGKAFRIAPEEMKKQMAPLNYVVELKRASINEYKASTRWIVGKGGFNIPDIDKFWSELVDAAPLKAVAPGQTDL